MKKASTQTARRNLARAIKATTTAEAPAPARQRPATPRKARKRADSANRPAHHRQGMNWITQVKRLAIYLRDGCACAYCGKGLEKGINLTLDHILPRTQHTGSISDAENLITACRDCNTSRGTRNVGVFARAVSAYINHGATAEGILSAILEKSGRKLAPFTVEAKALIARRGSAAKALAAL